MTECVHTQLHEADETLVDFTKDSEYKRLVEKEKKEKKRLPPMPPKSPYQ